MEKVKTTEQRVTRIICEQMGCEESEVTRNASFADDLGADSLDEVELVMGLEDEFEIQISDDEADKIKTVGQAIDAVEKRLANA